MRTFSTISGSAFGGISLLSLICLLLWSVVRRLSSVVLLVLLLSSVVCRPSSVQAGDASIIVIQPFDNAALAVNSTNYSPAVDLDYYKPWDFTYALQVQGTNLTSTNACGIVALSYELSNNNVDYLASSNIVTGFSFTNSPTSGGKGFYQFDAGKSRYIRFCAIVTQTNCWFSGWLAIQ